MSLWVLNERRRVSIHAPRARSDFKLTSNSRCDSSFNPRSPCEERHLQALVLSVRAEFQSTLPVRGATKEDYENYEKYKISIHAPRAGSDIPRRVKR